MSSNNTNANNSSNNKPLVLGGLELGGTTIRMCTLLILIALTSLLLTLVYITQACWYSVLTCNMLCWYLYVYKLGIVISHDTPTNVVFSKTIDTTTPDESFPVAYDTLKSHNIDCLGIGSFGPIDLNIHSPTYGYITSTPKLKWCNTPVVSRFTSLNVPTGFTTDVNAASMGEALYGNHGDNINNSCYITVGTGIGAGLMINNNNVEGLMHPEAGHILVKRHQHDTAYEGLCPYHNDCCEGLVAANAIADRLNIHYNQLKTLDNNHEIWDIVAYYLAQLCCSIILVASPQIIVLGGGVLKRTILYKLIQKHVVQLLNGYISVPSITKHIDKYIVPSRFDTTDTQSDDGTERSAGIVGVLTLAHETYKAHQKSSQ